jgi:inhibitor of KinA
MASTKNKLTILKSIIQPIADMGILVRFENESACQTFSNNITKAEYTWVLDVVPAYKAVALYHNPTIISLKNVTTEVNNLLKNLELKTPTQQSKVVEVPCCYELGADLEIVAELKGLTTKEVIRLHSETEYCVYAIGFSPGFPYMGYLPKELEGVPRLATPRLKVPAGSIGLTGIQTGLYPEEKPGGWHLIGQTPILLVDILTQYFAFNIGDKVHFSPISKSTFKKLIGTKLK